MLYYTYESIKYSPYTSVIVNPNNRKHKLQFWKITYAINGESEAVINGEKKPLRSNTILFVKPTDILQNTNHYHIEFCCQDCGLVKPVSVSADTYSEAVDKALKIWNKEASNE